MKMVRRELPQARGAGLDLPYRIEQARVLLSKPGVWAHRTAHHGFLDLLAQAIWPIAQTKRASSRATATTAWVDRFPRAINRWYFR